MAWVHWVTLAGEVLVLVGAIRATRKSVAGDVQVLMTVALLLAFTQLGHLLLLRTGMLGFLLMCVAYVLAITVTFYICFAFPRMHGGTPE